MYFTKLNENYLGSFIINGRAYDAYESSFQIFAKYGNKDLYKYSVDKIIINRIFNQLHPALKKAVILLNNK